MPVHLARRAHVDVAGNPDPRGVYLTGTEFGAERGMSPRWVLKMRLFSYLVVLAAFGMRSSMGFARIIGDFFFDNGSGYTASPITGNILGLKADDSDQ